MPSTKRTFSGFLLFCSLLVLAACNAGPPARTLRLATTTSTYDSGLLDAILPDFEARYGVEVEVIAVGTGQALALGEQGDVDVVLVHAPAKEEAFVEAGHGSARFPIMYNDFVIVGPQDDPAGVRAAPNAAAALAQIAQTQSPFASRGDQSGTHSRELELWAQASLTPPASEDWYYSLGQGMGATLNFANEKLAYTLADRGTFLALQSNLPDLAILFGGQSPADNPDPALRNFYSLIPVNPEKNSSIQADLAMTFVEWFTSIPTQEKIAVYGLERFGQQLFFPDSDLWRRENEGK